ncbi:uncharacterized protein LOC143010622 [Genypterus blacodes]|uniref:uncharacterized protein LOC143010622 n=1 Tax=Genypterus blacodes TaxID=154954 RepID=UPI003F7576D5
MMSGRLWLLSALLTLCVVLGESSVDGSSKAIRALVGDDVILPCQLDVQLDDSDVFPTVDWTKKGLERNVFLYRDGCETFEMKDPAYEYRSSLIMKELKNGDVSLRISNVQITDAGTYHCMVIYSMGKNTKKTTKTLELVVDAVSEPKAWLVEAEDGGLAVQCEVECCTLECEMMFLDHQGSKISPPFPKNDLDSSRCYTLKKRVTMPDHTDRIMCRVQLPEISQTRESEIQIPAACMRSCTKELVIAVILAILFMLILSGLAYGLWKIFCKSEAGSKVPLSRVSSDGSSASAMSCLLGDNSPHAREQSVDKQLQRNVDELESRLREKDETIKTLKDLLHRQGKDRVGPVPCQHSQTTLDCSPTSSNTVLNLPKHSDTISSTVPADPHPELSNDPNSCNSAHIPNPAASTLFSHPQPTNLSRNKARKKIIKQLSFQAPTHSLITRHNSCPSSFSCAAALPRSSALCKTPLTPLSDSGALPHPNTLRILPRRYSLLSNNRYEALAHLIEES